MFRDSGEREFRSESHCISRVRWSAMSDNTSHVTSHASGCSLTLVSVSVVTGLIRAGRSADAAVHVERLGSKQNVVNKPQQRPQRSLHPPGARLIASVNEKRLPDWFQRSTAVCRRCLHPTFQGRVLTTTCGHRPFPSIFEPPEDGLDSDPEVTAKQRSKERQARSKPAAPAHEPSPRPDS